MTPIYQFLSGAMLAGCWVAALFFFRFRAKTGDGLFTTFGLAFLILGFEQIMVLVENAQKAESHPLVYLFRLAGFVLILVGIVAKNRRGAGSNVV